MTTVIFTGYIGLGYDNNQGKFLEVSGGSYARQALTLAGNAQSGLNETTSSIAAATAPSGGEVAYGGFFDGSGGSANLLAYWRFPQSQVGAVGSAFPATALSVQFTSNVADELSRSGDVIDSGSQIGTVNGQPLVAATTLVINNNVISALGAGKVYDVPASSKHIFRVGGVGVMSVDGTGQITYLGSNAPASGTP